MSRHRAMGVLGTQLDSFLSSPVTKGAVDLSFGFLSAYHKGIIIMVKTTKIQLEALLTGFWQFSVAQQSSRSTMVPDNQQQSPGWLLWLGEIIRDALRVFLSTEPPLWGGLEPESCKCVIVCA